MACVIVCTYTCTCGRRSSARPSERASEKWHGIHNCLHTHPYLHAQIKRVVEQLLVVGADVQHNRKHAVRRDAPGGAVEGCF